MQSYSYEITLLQEIFLRLSFIIPELFEQIKAIISQNIIKYEISERNPEYSRIVNEVFFISLDSMLRILTSKPEIYELPPEDFFNLINAINDILPKALQLENNLILRTKEVISLQEILELINALLINNIANIENIKVIIQYFNEETIYIKNNKIRILCSNLMDFYNSLEKILGNLPKKKDFDFCKILSGILFDEYIKIGILEFREIILNIILEKNDLIKNSSQIIKTIIEYSGVDSEPDLMMENINCITEEYSLLFMVLNKTKNEFLEQIIMDIFERKIIKYYEMIPNLDEQQLKKNYYIYFNQNKKEKNKTGIIYDKSFYMFKGAIDILNSISENENNNENNINLLKLYSITYVKIYLFHLTNFITNNFEQMNDIKEIINYINNISNKSFSRIIKIYILKLIFNFKNCNFTEFKKFDFSAHGISFYKEFSFAKKNDSMLTYLFLPSEPSDFSKYNEIENVYIKDANIKKNRKELEILLDKYGLDLFLIMIINKIISNLPYSNNELLDSYKSFSRFAKAIFNDKNPQFKNLSNILLLFFDFDIYTKKLKYKIGIDNGKIDMQVFEALLYGFRFCINSLCKGKGENSLKNNSLYSSLLLKPCQKIIEKALIPGNDNKKDIHLITLENIRNHFNTYPADFGCYVCSCGYYYCISPCGFPTLNHSFPCPECHQLCGWGPKVKSEGANNYGMVIRERHILLL